MPDKATSPMARVLSPKPAGIPELLRDLPRWLTWVHGADKQNGSGRYEKIPVNWQSGKACNAHDSANWLTFDAACKALAAGRFSGIAIDLPNERDPVATAADGTPLYLIGGDIDECIVENQFSPEALAVREYLHNTYFEVSPSGTGLRFFGLSATPLNGGNKNGKEMYSGGRFLTITGRGTGEILEITHELEQLQNQWFPPSKTRVEGNLGKPPATETPEQIARIEDALSVIPADDYEVWLKIGMALHQSELTAAESLWDKWSAASDKFDPIAQAKTWSSLNSSGNVSGQITIGTIFHIAKTYGWVDKTCPQHISEFNDAFFVSNEGGKSGVYKEDIDPVLNRRKLVLFSKQSFELQYANEYAVVNDARKNAASDWLKHPMRRSYERIVFDPIGNVHVNCYNLWQGFAVIPVAGDWSKLQQHILDVICCGNTIHCRYILGWMARAVQYRNQPGEVALVFRGGRGTGKGILARSLARLFGQHGLQIFNAKHLTGNFNAHLRDCILLYCDEAFWAGDKSGEAVLKGLITEPTIFVEGKGKDALSTPNFLHIVMTSNEDWVVPAGNDERRFAAFDVSSQHQQDEPYFKAIQNQLDNGGLEAMLYDLLHYPLKGYSVRAIPNTTALQQQKINSLDRVARWFFERLAEERLSYGDSGWIVEQVKGNITRNFSDYCQRNGLGQFNNKSDATILGAHLKKLLGQGLQSTRPTINGRREYCWAFPDLATCRKAFEAYYRLDPINWNTV